MLRNKLLDSPLDEWLKVEWPQFSANLISVRARREDVLLYLVWTLDGLKAGEPSLIGDTWNFVREKLRDHFIDHGMTAAPEDLNHMTNTVIALSLGCLGLTLKDDFDHQDLYTKLVKRLGKHWSEVSACKQMLKLGEHTKQLEPWITGYMQTGIYLTVADVMEWDDDVRLQRLDFSSISKVVGSNHLPAMLSVEKTKELYLILRENNFIEQCVTEEDFLQLFGCRKSEKELQPIKWLIKKDDLLVLLRGIYDIWEVENKPTWNSITQIANNYFVGKKGKKYSESMKLKESYKGQNTVITDFLATI